MTIAKSQYFYDKQIRRYLLQAIRMFSGFSVYDGKNNNNEDTFKMIPCTYADMTRLGATYLSNNSQNMLNSAPSMAIHVTDFQPLPEYRHAPHYEGNSYFTQKQKDSNGNYINKPGKKYHVQQLMPVPFSMTLNLDIWTTSTDQKLEILEQLLVWFNPGYEFLVNSSPFDMGRVCNIELENIQWTSRSVPESTSVEIDIATLTFKLYPIFITSPGKIMRQTLIHNIQINNHLTEDILSNTLDDIFENNNIETSNIVVSPSGYKLEVYKDSGEYFARLVSPQGYGNWSELFDTYGEVVENETFIKIRQSADAEDDRHDIYATYENTGDDQVIKLNFDIDTFRPTTIDPVNKIINPNNGIPSDAEIGSRYLIADEITIADWGINANMWDIIELNSNGDWFIDFDSQNESEVQYVKNLKRMDLYVFLPEDKEWIAAVLGVYEEGYWLFDVQKVQPCQ
ncbi:hypothetical protein PBI_SCTP2_240 [Salicola phage SCTP-2]|nr:hypothetical protein PBI_SCTP2_240 [Salicola phage SCTP-2]